MRKKEIIIVDDHQIIAAGIRALLGDQQIGIQITECSSVNHALNLLEESSDYDLLLTDISMPSLSGLDLLVALLARRINVPAAVFSGSEDHSEIQQCLDTGAVGFIPKSASPALILDGILQMLEGKAYLPPHLRNYVFFNHIQNVNCRKRVQAKTSEQHAKVVLKQREVEVLKLLTSGKSNKEIANLLGISLSTVKYHMSHLFRKTNARSRTECISIAGRRELLAEHV